MADIQEVVPHFRLDQHVEYVEVANYPGAQPMWGFVDTSVEPPAYALVMEETEGLFYGDNLVRAEGVSGELGANGPYRVDARGLRNPYYYASGPLSEYAVLATTDDPRMFEVAPDYEHYTDPTELRARVPVDVAAQGLVISGLANRLLAKEGK